MRRVYITRYAAIGDHIHASFLPRFLKEEAGFDYVAFEYNQKGWYVYQNNPFIDEHIQLEPSVPPLNAYPVSFFEKRWKYIKESGGFEKHINLKDSLERAYIAMEEQDEYYRGSARRRERYGKLNYYDQTAEFAGYPEAKGRKGEFYFTAQEEDVVRGIYNEKYKENFVVICNLSGTSKHKLFYGAEDIIKQFLARHKDAICITMGDKACQEHIEFKGDRIINRAGVYPFRQSMLMAKYADLVIGCESGLMVAATTLGAPTLQLMTAASIKNHGGDFLNDYSLQSPAVCSPCHKGPYQYIGCPKFEHLGLQYPVCVKFNPEVVLQRMDKIYDNPRTTQEAKTPELSAV